MKKKSLLIHNDSCIPKTKIGRPTIWRIAFTSCIKQNDWFFAPIKRVSFYRTYYYWKKALSEEVPAIYINFKLYKDATVKCRKCDWGTAKEQYLSQVKHGRCPMCKSDNPKILQEGTQVRRSK